MLAAKNYGKKVKDKNHTHKEEVHKYQCNKRNLTYNEEIITSSIYQIYLCYINIVWVPKFTGTW